MAYRQERVTSIDPATRQVVTDGNSYQPDILVVALGADYDLTATPGFEADGYEYYSVAGAVRDVLQSFSGGRVLIAILGVPFKCRRHRTRAPCCCTTTCSVAGVRDATQIDVISPMESPIPVSPETSAAIVKALAERAIGYTPGRRVRGLNPRTHRAQLKTGRWVRSR